MRRVLKILAVCGVGVVGAAVLAAPAFATSITAPSGPTFVVPGDASGNPQSFTVTATGFSSGAVVSIEQCDGKSPSDPTWTATADCDLGSSPAAATADGSGNVTFPANDPNFGFTPFKNISPQHLFNCLSPNDPALNPTNHKTDWRNCQIRVSTNNTAATADQTFLTLQLPDAVQGGEVPEVPYAVVLPIGAVAIGGAFLVVRKRRSAHVAS